MRRHAAAGLAASVALLSLANCLNLPDIDKNVCGNRVIEDEAGEDCDGNPVPDAGVDGDVDAGEDGAVVSRNRCGAMCRWVCNVSDDPDVRCPDGFGCGIDGICHKRGGLSLPALSIGGGGVRRLLGGDFDGDGRHDAVALGDSSLDILFFETNGLIDRTLTVPNDRRLPAIGDLDADGASDLVLNLGDALGVLTGQGNRTLKPRSYHSGDVDGDTRQVVPLGRIKNETTLLALISEDGQTTLDTIVIGANNTPVSTKVGGVQPEKWAGELTGAVAVSVNTKSGSECPVVAFEVESFASVILLSCGESGKLAEDPKEITIPFPPGNSPWAGAFFADADADGDDDLLVGTVDNGGNRYLRFLQNNGSGTFTEAADPPAVVVESGNCGGRVLADKPLAVGDLDGNGALDVVDERGVLYNPYQVQESYTKSCIDASEVSWSRAVIGDFNGNGLPDILAAREGQTLLDVWSRVEGGELNTFTVPVEEFVGELAVGDFDGDSVDDAVFSYKPPTPPDTMKDKPPPHELLVLFGRPLAVPDAPLSLGEFQDLEHIAAGRVKGENALGAPDLLDDLVVLSTSPMSGRKPLTIIEGNVGRRLLAPLTIKEPPSPLPPTAKMPTQIAVSRFGREACEAPEGPRSSSEPTHATATIVAGTLSEIWLAGCRRDGSSERVLDSLATNGSMLIAPVNVSPVHDALGLFLGGSNGSGSHGLRMVTRDPNTGFEASSPPDVIPEKLILPSPDPFDAPSLVVDVDGDGRRDVVLLSDTQSQNDENRPRSAIVIYWNDGEGDTLDEDRRTLIGFPDALLKEDDDTSVDSNASQEIQGIADFAFLNLDDDAALELAVLTRRGLYLLDMGNDGGRKFPLPSGEPFDAFPGGQALLAIDANSDGIEDLLVAEGPKLLLYLGKEAAR
ncbi:FG-GAP repeat domain-containing protein [Polyangium spumosum]|uniref:VCBS repeat-containing protein n=1 Tax=Polyangium spumosum TaxID=889282 RepID=A0A6N7PYE6_9BACT|nr:VCBS repeat-containing protein [Polyangium spumosum]MRG96587.1 hypothetical protein [Polyangium spumosum]